MTTETSPQSDAEAGKNDTLPFSNPKQEALLGHLLTDPKFFLICKDKIRSEWWVVPRMQVLWDMVLKLSQAYSRPVTAAEVGDCQQMSALDLAETNRFKSLIQLCLTRRGEFGLDILQNDLTDWLHTRIYLKAMKQSEDLFNIAARGGGKNKERLSEAFAALKKMTREIDDTSFEYGHVEEMRIEDIEGAKIDAKNAVDFGLPKLNQFLNPEGMGDDGHNISGLLKGDMTVLLAPTNVGKTTTMVTCAVVNILSGRDVLLITHEGRIADIKLKIWQCMMEDDRQTLMSGVSKPKYRERLEEMRQIMATHLEFMPLNKAGMAVEEVEAIIRRRQERWQSNHGGKGFDMIIDDYAAKLTTQQARGGQFQLRQIHEIVYNYFSQIALEHNVHVMTAIQTNREGSKVNNRIAKGAEARFLTMEDVMEAWGPMTTATNVISINRPPEARARNITGFMICKSRSSDVGVVFLAKSKFACARSHWPVSADGSETCEEYQLTAINGDRVEKLLEDFQGLEVGDAQVNSPQAQA